MIFQITEVSVVPSAIFCHEVYFHKVEFLADFFKYLNTINKDMRKNHTNLGYSDKVNAFAKKYQPGNKGVITENSDNM